MNGGLQSRDGRKPAFPQPSSPSPKACAARPLRSSPAPRWRAPHDARLETSTTETIVDEYESTQLLALRAGLLAAALLALASLAFIADPPHEQPTRDDHKTEPAAARR